MVMGNPDELVSKESSTEKENKTNENNEFKPENVVNDLNKTIKEKWWNMDAWVTQWANKCISNSDLKYASFVAKNLDMLNWKGVSKDCINNIIDHVFWQWDESRVSIFCTQTFKCCSLEDKQSFADAIVERWFDKDLSISDPELLSLVKEGKLKQEKELQGILDEIPDEENNMNTEDESTRKRPERPLTLQVPHALDMDITDKAIKEMDRYSEEFKVFWDAVQALDYACYMWASPNIWDKALMHTLKELSNKNEKNILKVKSALKNFTDNLQIIDWKLDSNYKVAHARVNYVEDEWEIWKQINNCIKQFESDIE